METILFLIALGGVILVLLWAIRNEGNSDSETTGLFRMRDTDSAANTEEADTE